MNIRVLIFLLIMTLAGSHSWVNGQTSGQEAAAADEHFQPRRKPKQSVSFEQDLPKRFQKNIRRLGEAPDRIPEKPMQDYFWEYVLLIFGLVFLFWIGLLVLGLVVTSSTAAAILLGIAAATAYLGIVAFLIALIALLMIITRQERKARRRQFWGNFW